VVVADGSGGGQGKAGISAVGMMPIAVGAAAVGAGVAAGKPQLNCAKRIAKDVTPIITFSETGRVFIIYSLSFNDYAVCLGEKIGFNLFNISIVPLENQLKFLEEWQPVASSENFARYRNYAGETFRKDARVKIHISSKDLESLKKRALKEGIPYQTLIASVLHKYISGRLVDRLR
jgi:predicted DNA binding CopG/RHH family protein